jgi:hypothetical protein
MYPIVYASGYIYVQVQYILFLFFFFVDNKNVHSVKDKLSRKHCVLHILIFLKMSVTYPWDAKQVT